MNFIMWCALAALFIVLVVRFGGWLVEITTGEN